MTYFWQDGVKAAKRSIQMEIQTAVHKIYQQLSVTLERALQANKHHIGKHMLCTVQQIIFKAFLNEVSPKLFFLCFSIPRFIVFFKQKHKFMLWLG